MADIYEEKVKPFIAEQVRVFMEWQFPLNALKYRQAFLTFTYPSLSTAIEGFILLHHQYDPKIKYALTLSVTVSPDGNESPVDIILTYPDICTEGVADDHA